MKKKILLLDTGKEWGGGTNSMIELLKRIDRQRFDITALFYYNYARGSESDLKRELAVLNIPLIVLPQSKQPLWIKLAKELVRGLLVWHPFLKRSLIHAIDQQWRIRPNARRIAHQLSIGKFDLLYMNNQPSSNLEGYLAAQALGLPVIQHCRVEPVLRQAEVDIVNRVAKQIICVSQGVADALIAAGVQPEKCIVVNNAIDGTQPIPEPIHLSAIAKDAIVIGSVGSLMTRKANDHFLRAAADVKNQTALPLHFVLVGEGPERQRLEQLAEALGLSSHISFAGFQRAPLPWIAAMDIVVLASPSEGLPRVVLEAMLLGKPVIASDVVGSRELVLHETTGLLYPYSDISALSTALVRLANNPKERQSMGAAGRQRVLKEYSIEQYVRGVQNVLAG